MLESNMMKGTTNNRIGVCLAVGELTHGADKLEAIDVKGLSAASLFALFGAQDIRGTMFVRMIAVR